MSHAAPSHGPGATGHMPAPTRLDLPPAPARPTARAHPAWVEAEQARARCYQVQTVFLAALLVLVVLAAIPVAGFDVHWLKHLIGGHL